MNVAAVNHHFNNKEFSLGAVAADFEGNYIYEDYKKNGLHMFEINLDRTIDNRDNKKKYYPKKLRRSLIQGE